jgi:hypothetical protein
MGSPGRPSRICFMPWNKRQVLSAHNGFSWSLLQENPASEIELPGESVFAELVGSSGCRAGDALTQQQ